MSLVFLWGVTNGRHWRAGARLLGGPVKPGHDNDGGKWCGIVS
jgi:hypothetical protein